MPRSMLFGAGAAVVALAVLAFGGWYLFIRSDAPPPASLADAVASVASTTATATATTGGASTAEASPTGTSSAGTEGGATGSADGDLSGTWSVDAANSFVGYRIEEELARIGSATAVGRTSDVSGTLAFDGTTISAVEVVADLRTLKSDDERRDGQLQRQALESNEFPDATFVLAEPIAVEGDPASGEAIAATAVGDLTIHGVTNRVELSLEGQLVDGQVVVVGSTPILLSDYGIDAPESMMVLSVADEAMMEMQLIFTRA